MLLTPWYNSLREPQFEKPCTSDSSDNAYSVPKQFAPVESRPQRPQTLHRAYTDSVCLQPRDHDGGRMDEMISQLMQGDQATRLRIANMLISSSLPSPEMAVNTSIPAAYNNCNIFEQLPVNSPTPQWHTPSADFSPIASRHDAASLSDFDSFFQPRTYQTGSSVGSPQVAYPVYTPEMTHSEWQAQELTDFSPALTDDTSRTSAVDYEYNDPSTLYLARVQERLCNSVGMPMPRVDCESATVSEPDFTELDDSLFLPASFAPEDMPEESTLQTVGRRKWTRWEDETLTAAVARYAHHLQKWKRIANEIPGRSAKLCAKRWHYLEKSSVKGYKKGKWAHEEDLAVIEAVNNWTARTSDNIDWNKIAATLPTPRSGSQVQARYTEKLDSTVKKGWWSDEEVMELERAVLKHKGCWFKAAQELPGRTQRQCRMRYLRHIGASGDNDMVR